jgi:DNA-binding response OmpR family regulator
MTKSYDLMVVDWMLPRQDGVSLIQQLRSADIDTPILMLTALSDEEDCVTGLDAGADDYLTKPFSFSVLFARLRALERRGTAPMQPAFRLAMGPLVIDRRGRTAYWDEDELDLRAKEFTLLELLVRRANQTVSRTVMAESVWGSAFVTDDTINTTVSGLRRKLSDVDADAALTIETQRGIGYRLVSEGATESA